MWRYVRFQFVPTGRSMQRLTAIVMLWLAASQAGAEPFACAPLVASASRHPAYGPVSDRSRCEGFYEKNVSQPFLELVSLTRSPPGVANADEDRQLTLRGSPRVDTRLVIQPMRSNPLYRVDAALARGATFVWASGMMLQATGLRMRDLGFLAQSGASSEPVAFAPVSLQAFEDGDVAYAVLRPSVAVSTLAWRGYRVGSATLTGAWQLLGTTPIFAWARTVIPISLPADGHGLHIDVRAVDQQGKDLPLLQFVVLGVRDEAP